MPNPQDKIPPASPPTPPLPHVPQNPYSALQPPPSQGASADQVAGAMPSEPTEDEVIQEAKALCHEAGKAWRQDDFGHTLAGKLIADDEDRGEYVNRARALLKWS